MHQTSRNQTDFTQFAGKDIITQPSNHFISSLEPRLPVDYPQQLETSFEQDMGESHSQQIWKASIKFLKASLKGDVDEQIGLNSQDIFSCLFENVDFDSHEENVSNIVCKNTLFIKNQTRSQFSIDLKSQPNLQKLLIHLSKLFHEEIFHQICIIVQESWEIYLKEKEKMVLPLEISNLMAKGFKDLDAAEENQKKPKFLAFNPEELVCLTNNASEEISSVYYINSRIKFLNLKESEKEKRPERIVREEFQHFLQTIVNCVFLCLQGEFFSLKASQQLFNNVVQKEFLSEFPSSEIESETIMNHHNTPQKRKEQKM